MLGKHENNNIQLRNKLSHSIEIQEFCTGFSKILKKMDVKTEKINRIYLFMDMFRFLLMNNIWYCSTFSGFKIIRTTLKNRVNVWLSDFKENRHITTTKEKRDFSHLTEQIKMMLGM